MESYSELMHKQRTFFFSDQTRDVSFRINQLKKLKALVVDNERAIMDALHEDLNKSDFEAYTTEVGVALAEINFAIKHLAAWTKLQKVRTPMTHFGAKSVVYAEPYGVTLIISPWNYPFYLSVAPLVGAIGGGNCAVLKPSEFTPATSTLLAELISEYFSPEYVSVIEGGVDTSKALLNEKWDYIFFTGNTSVGKAIMASAAKHLTPVTLELGGKSPCIVHRDAKLALAAKRIVWGKFLNAGQTCVAPDYALVHEEVKDQLFEHLHAHINAFYGENPLESEHYPKIVSAKHFDRLNRLLESGDVRIGGRTDRDRLVIEPTVINDVNWDDPVMEDEIFGPILPIIAYESLSEIIERINNRPKPLALYVFSEDREVQDKVLKSVSFGGGCVNDTLYHLASPHLPFGGVGESGIGAYHGKGSFDTFTHKKSVLKQTTLFDIPLRYPNIKDGLKKVKLFLK